MRYTPDKAASCVRTPLWRRPRAPRAGAPAGSPQAGQRTGSVHLQREGGPGPAAVVAQRRRAPDAVRKFPQSGPAEDGLSGRDYATHWKQGTLCDQWSLRKIWRGQLSAHQDPRGRCKLIDF